MIEIRADAFQDLSKFTLPDNFREKPGWFVQMWWIVQWFLLRPSPQFMYGWRAFWLRLFGAKLGNNVRFRPNAQITYPWKVSIGDNVWIADEVMLYSLGPITIGSNTNISHRTILCTGSHDYTSYFHDITAAPIVIGSGVWIAMDVFVSPGVTIGDGAVVGVRSLVNNDLPAGMVCYGSPAKPVKPRMMKNGKYEQQVSPDIAVTNGQTDPHS